MGTRQENEDVRIAAALRCGLHSLSFGALDAFIAGTPCGIAGRSCTKACKFSRSAWPQGLCRSSDFHCCSVVGRRETWLGRAVVKRFASHVLVLGSLANLC